MPWMRALKPGSTESKLEQRTAGVVLFLLPLSFSVSHAKESLRTNMKLSRGTLPIARRDSTLNHVSNLTLREVLALYWDDLKVLAQ